MQFRRLPRFSLGTLFLLIACLACYLAGFQQGRRNESSHVQTKKKYSVSDLLPSRNDNAQYWQQLNGVRWFAEESLNNTSAFYDMTPPVKVTQQVDGSISASLPPYRLNDFELVLAELRRLKRVADSRGEPFGIPPPFRNRAQFETRAE